MYTSHATNDHPVRDLPAFLTVEEAAAIVRVGRTCAYQLARQFEFTDGAQGLPVVRVGRQLRVPLARLEEWAGATLTAPVELPQVPVGHDNAGEDRPVESDPASGRPIQTVAATPEHSSPHETTSVDAKHVDEETSLQDWYPTLPFGS